MKTPDDFREFINAEKERQGKTVTQIAVDAGLGYSAARCIFSGKSRGTLYSAEDILDALGYSFTADGEMVSCTEIGEIIETYRLAENFSVYKMKSMLNTSDEVYRHITHGENIHLTTMFNAANACGIEIGVKSFRKE